MPYCLSERREGDIAFSITFLMNSLCFPRTNLTRVINSLRNHSIKNFIYPLYHQSFKMKLPKKTKRYCPFCKKQTEQKIDVASTGIKRGPLAWGSLTRARARGKARGFGNKGRWGSKPAINNWKRKTKATKRLVVLYKCTVCKKSKPAKFGRRVSKIQLEEKQAK